jgi:hypothetical protein
MLRIQADRLPRGVENHYLFILFLLDQILHPLLSAGWPTSLSRYRLMPLVTP